MSFGIFHKAQTCTFKLVPYRYGIIGIIDEGLRFLYICVPMIFIVKCISMYILFGHECEQSLCGAERAQHSRHTERERHCVAKRFSQLCANWSDILP